MKIYTADRLFSSFIHPHLLNPPKPDPIFLIKSVMAQVFFFSFVNYCFG